MEIYAKVGTMGQSVVRVKYKRKKPEVGDLIYIRERDFDRTPWVRCKVDEIRDLGYELFFLSKISSI